MLKKKLLFILCIFCNSSWGIQIEIHNKSIFVQNKKILQILTSKDGLSPLQRIKKIKENLVNASINSQSTIKTIRKSNTIHLLANEHLIAIANLQEAKKQNTSLDKLATQWKNNLIKALYQPPFSFSKDIFLLEKLQAFQFHPTGNNLQNIQIVNHTPDIIDANFIQNTLYIDSKEIGKGKIEVQLGSYKKMLTFEVLPLAGTVPEEINTYIVGQNHSTKTLQKTIAISIKRACNLLSFGQIKTSFKNVNFSNSSDSYSIKVAVEATAPQAITVKKNVTVTIKNLGMPHKTDKMLWYCNYPESIKSFGDISSIHLKSNFPTRILFHHINMMSTKLGIQFLIKNYSDQYARLVLIHGEGEPHIDPVKVGQEAAKRFMRTYIQDEGDVIEVPPGHEIPLSIQKLKPKETISGLLSICLLPLGAQSVHITAQAIPTEQLEPLWKNSIGKPFPWQTAAPILITREKKSWPISKHLFPTPNKKIDVKYQVGGPFCFIRIGQVPISDSIKMNILEGNFGVTYQIKARVTNPTMKAVPIEAVFEASAGYSSGIFVVNHQLKTAPLLLSKQEFTLNKTTLQPLQSKIIHITTLPISGSSYPATITIRPVSKY